MRENAAIKTTQHYGGCRNEMNRLIAIALTLSACTSTPATDAEIHEVTQCADNWSGHYGVTSYGSCEMPCADLQQLGSSGCAIGGGETCAPGHSITFGERQGCCVVDRAEAAVAFVECE